MTNAYQKALEQLPAKSVSTILTELLKIREASKMDTELTVPLAAFHLRSGRTLTGWILSSAEEKGQKGLLVHAPGPDPSQPQYDVHYIEPSLIEAITVFNAGMCANLLSFGQISAPPGVPPPSKIQVRQKAEDAGKTLASETGWSAAWEVDASALAKEGEPLRVASEVVRETTFALRAILEQPMGKDALKAIKKVFIKEGQAGVALKGSTLMVSAPLAQGAKGRLSSADLRKAIESKF